MVEKIQLENEQDDNHLCNYPITWIDQKSL